MMRMISPWLYSVMRSKNEEWNRMWRIEWDDWYYNQQQSYQINNVIRNRHYLMHDTNLCDWKWLTWIVRYE